MDRNTTEEVLTNEEQTSLSARRAWIEIVGVAQGADTRDVALRKESVDRNIIVTMIQIGLGLVALRKESVDRN